MTAKGRWVYSSGPGQTAETGPRGEAMCKRCGAFPCRCEPQESLPPDKQSVHVRFERSGRKGKTVTVCGPLRLRRADAMTLLKSLKKKCGGGGALKTSALPSGEPAFELEVQGDHVERLKTELGALGYRTKG